MTGDLNMGSHKIASLTDPTNAQDAATKAYVDAMATGLDLKASVKAASTGNLTLSGTQTVDGVSLVVGDRVLVKNQSTASQNGIYVVASGAWTRATDADSAIEVTAGMFVFVEQGTVNADSGWVLTTDGAITLGTTALTFSQFSGAGQITAGAGLTKTGNTLEVATASTARIVVNADNIDLATSGVTAGTYVNTKVTVDAYGRVTYAADGQLGDFVPLVSGATEKTTPVDADLLLLLDSAAGNAGKKLSWTNIKATLKTYFDTLYTGGALAKYSTTVGDGTNTTLTVTHNLGSRNVMVQVYLTASPYEEVDVAVDRYDANTVKLYFAVAPASGAYTVVVIG